MQLHSRKRKRLEDQLQEARDLLASFQFDDAALVLKAVTAVNDVRVRDVVDQGAELLQQLEIEKTNALTKAEEALARAQQNMSRHAYEAVIAEIQDIHPNLRSAEMGALLDSATAVRNEILSLGGEIREGLARKEFGELLPKIARLLTLKPDYKNAASLAEQLRDKQLAAARQFMNVGNFAEAVNILSAIPDFVSTPQFEELKDQAQELDCLLDELRTSTHACEVTQAIGKRLVTVAPNCSEAITLHGQLTKSAASNAVSPRSPLPVWAPPPRRTSLGVPVDWWGGLAKLEIVDPRDQATLTRHPGQLQVALGLATQGLALQPSPLNLLPQRKQSVLQSIRLPFGAKASPKAAWGIDLSPSGLKAICLTKNKETENIRIENVFVHSHELDATNPNTKLDRRELATRALQTFLEKHSIAATDQVVINIAGSDCLGRFFEIPPMAEKTVASTIEYEARMQLPLPLPDLEWRYQINDPRPAAEADANPRQIAVVATPKSRVQERVALFAAAGITPHAVISDCVALHQAAVLELFADQAASPQSAPTYCVIDVGVEGTNIVISSPRHLWFRSLTRGTHELTCETARGLNLTYLNAAALRHQPHRANRLYRLKDSWQKFFAPFAADITISLNAYHKQFPRDRVTHVYGTGGGFRTHGLLRYLRSGN